MGTPTATNVLLLGAGRVAAPAVRYLADSGLSLCVAANDADDVLQRLSAAAGGRLQIVRWSSDDLATLRSLVEQNDVVISLLPAQLHDAVADICVASRRHLVTASYTSPHIRSLDGKANSAGVVLCTELGLDPGIDHMSAMQVIDAVRQQGRHIRGFRSYCGGIPAPEANDNPWGYKFSWSPLGALRATRSAALYLERGKRVELDALEVLQNTHPVSIPGLGELEGYANRDALSYIDTYQLQGVQTMFRGTLRYPGWCESLAALHQLGLMSDDPVPAGASWAKLVGSRRSVAERFCWGDDHPVLTRLEWLGLFSDKQPSSTPSSLIEALADRMQQKMNYAVAERDMIVMRHEFAVDDGSSITSSLVCYGEPDGDSAMARTVGLPVAMTARLLVERRLTLTGVQLPVHPQIYGPVLKELAGHQICFAEEVAPGGR